MGRYIDCAGRPRSLFILSQASIIAPRHIILLIYAHSSSIFITYNSFVLLLILIFTRRPTIDLREHQVMYITNWLFTILQDAEEVGSTPIFSLDTRITHAYMFTMKGR